MCLSPAVSRVRWYAHNYDELGKRECAYLLQYLEYADRLMIMMTKVRESVPISCSI